MTPYVEITYKQRTGYYRNINQKISTGSEDTDKEKCNAIKILKEIELNQSSLTSIKN